jgi:hypothetical protein
LIEVALDQNGTESAETHDPRSSLDRVGCRSTNPGDVLVRVGGAQTVGRNEGVDIKAMCLGVANTAADRSDADMADGSWRNPWKDVLDLVVRQRSVLWSAQDSEYVRSRPPTLLMPDQGEIDRGRQSTYGYTGS